jgi:hydrogenase maturation protease
VSACIVGIGEPMAGDDAVGIRVVERLRALPELRELELVTLRDPSELCALLPGYERALIVDARLDPERAGEVELASSFDVGRARIAGGTQRALSSHGVDTLSALELGRVLAEERGFPSVALLTVAIARPDRLRDGLSEPVSRAVGEAVRRAVAWAEGAADA